MGPELLHDFVHAAAFAVVQVLVERWQVRLLKIYQECLRDEFGEFLADLKKDRDRRVLVLLVKLLKVIFLDVILEEKRGQKAFEEGLLCAPIQYH